MSDQLPVIWFTGLPCAGKSTLARALAEALQEHGLQVTLLDGDALRASTSADLGFDRAGRLEQARRAAEAAVAERAAGAVPLVATISPYREGRALARDLVGEGFVEVHVDAPVAVCSDRDTRGMWALARKGRLRNFTGVDDPYEPPRSPEVRLDTSIATAAACTARLLAHLAPHLERPAHA